MENTHEKISNFISEFENIKHPNILNHCIQTLLRISQSPHDMNDLKIIDTTLTELRKTIKVFHPFRDYRKVCIFGSARTPENAPDFKLCEELGKRLTDEGYMTITGAGGGIMEAGNKGSENNMTFGLNIMLPFEQHANKYIENSSKLVDYKYFFNRKLSFIKESDATILMPGGFGTHDEGFEVLTLLQNGCCPPRPVILLTYPENNYWDYWIKFIKKSLNDTKYISPSDLYLFESYDNVEDCLKFINKFYSIYHSIRYIENHTVIRINSEISDKKLKSLQSQFKPLMKNGILTQYAPMEFELDSEEYPDKYRLVFQKNELNYGLLTKMIIKINE